MRSIVMNIVWLTIVLIFPLSVQAKQPTEPPPPAGPIEELQSEIQNLQDQIDNIKSVDLNSIYLKSCYTSGTCECDDPNDLVIAVTASCRSSHYQLWSTFVYHNLYPGCTLEDVGTQWQVKSVGGAQCSDFDGTSWDDPGHIVLTCLKDVGPLTCEAGWNAGEIMCVVTGNCNFHQ